MLISFILILIWMIVVLLLIRGSLKLMRKSYDRKKPSKKKKRVEKSNQEKIIDELNQLKNSLVEDWNSSIFSDKISTAPGTVVYRKENGDVITMHQNDIEVRTSTERCVYTVGSYERHAFVSIFNRMIQIINAGNAGQRDIENETHIPSPKRKTSDNPKRDLYENLLENIRLRKDSLNKLPKFDENRRCLENELRVAEMKANRLKMEYNL